MVLYKLNLPFIAFSKKSVPVVGFGYIANVASSTLGVLNVFVIVILVVVWYKSQAPTVCVIVYTPAVEADKSISPVKNKIEIN